MWAERVLIEIEQFPHRLVQLSIAKQATAAEIEK